MHLRCTTSPHSHAWPHRTLTQRTHSLAESAEQVIFFPSLPWSVTLGLVNLDLALRQVSFAGLVRAVTSGPPQSISNPTAGGRLCCNHLQLGLAPGFRVPRFSCHVQAAAVTTANTARRKRSRDEPQRTPARVRRNFAPPYFRSAPFHAHLALPTRPSAESVASVASPVGHRLVRLLLGTLLVPSWYPLSRKFAQTFLSPIQTLPSCTRRLRS